MAKTSGDRQNDNRSDLAATDEAMQTQSDAAAAGGGAPQTSMTADDLFGTADVAARADAAPTDALLGSEQDEHVWDGSFPEDDALDAFVKQTGTGTDYIHDFEAEADVVDLSAYNISYQDLQSVMQDVGWATQIELTGFSGQVDDRIYLKNVEPGQLDETNFSL